MKVCDVITFIEKTAPKELAEKWDSPGLKTGSLNSEISKILVSLDISPTVVQEAIDKECNMIISHHPILFHPISYISEDNEKALCLAIKNNISIYCAHTNLDFAVGGINDSLAEIIGLKNIQKDESGKHAYGNLEKSLTISEFVESIKTNLGTACVTAVIPKHILNTNHISKIGVSSGSYDGNIDWALELGVDVLVTGELKHFEYLSLNEENIVTIGAGHYFTEIPGMRALAKRLNAEGFESIISSEEKNPFIFI